MIKIFSRIFNHESRYLRITLHILFWIVVWQFIVYLKSAMFGLSYWRTSLIATKDLAIICAIFYFISYFVVPRFLVKRRFLMVLLSLLLVYYFYAFSVLIEFMVLPRIVDIPGRGYAGYMSRVLPYGFMGILTFRNSAEILFDMSYLLSPAVIVKLFVELVQVTTRSMKLEVENVNLELAFLKSQINPHFLFNTLNNVYSLALHKSNLAAEAILQLSDLMRYTLYDSNTGQIALEKEVMFFKNYIELERMRHNAKVSIDFEVKGNFDSLYVAPLIIFPFIENAFKHGIDITQSKSWIWIRLTVEGNSLFVIVKNSLGTTKSNLVDTVGGIGVENAIKRLNLLYPGHHRLDVGKKENYFLVDLKIDLKNHKPSNRGMLS